MLAVGVLLWVVCVVIVPRCTLANVTVFRTHSSVETKLLRTLTHACRTRTCVDAHDPSALALASTCNRSSQHLNSRRDLSGSAVVLRHAPVSLSQLPCPHSTLKHRSISSQCTPEKGGTHMHAPPVYNLHNITRLIHDIHESRTDF